MLVVLTTFPFTQNEVGSHEAAFLLLLGVFLIVFAFVLRRFFKNDKTEKQNSMAQNHTTVN